MNPGASGSTQPCGVVSFSMNNKIIWIQKASFKIHLFNIYYHFENFNWIDK